MHTRALRFSLVLTPLALLLLGPADVRATSVPDGLVRTVPVDGAVHPANAPILFDTNLDEGPFTLTAIVDHERAEVVTVEPRSRVGAALMGYSDYRNEIRIEPPPLPGQSVRISGTFCERCIEETLEFTVGEPDLTPPPAPTLDLLKVTYTSGCLPGSTCDDEWRLTIVEAPELTGGRSPEIYPLVYLITPRYDGVTSTEPPFPLIQTEPAGVLTQSGGVGTASDIADFCVDVQVLDLGGNLSDPVSTCGSGVQEADFQEFNVGEDPGGCQAVPGRAPSSASLGLLAALLVALGLLLRFRRV